MATLANIATVLVDKVKTLATIFKVCRDAGGKEERVLLGDGSEVSQVPGGANQNATQRIRVAVVHVLS